MEWLWWSVALLGIFLIGLTKSGFGAGVGLMVVPMMAIAMGNIPSRGSEAALGLMLPLLIIGDLIAVWQYRRLFAFRRSAVPAAVPVSAASDAPAGVDPPATDGRDDAPSPIARQ